MSRHFAGWRDDYGIPVAPPQPATMPYGRITRHAPAPHVPPQPSEAPTPVEIKPAQQAEVAKPTPPDVVLPEHDDMFSRLKRKSHLAPGEAPRVWPMDRAR